LIAAAVVAVFGFVGAAGVGLLVWQSPDLIYRAVLDDEPQIIDHEVSEESPKKLRQGAVKDGRADGELRMGGPEINRLLQEQLPRGWEAGITIQDGWITADTAIPEGDGWMNLHLRVRFEMEAGRFTEVDIRDLEAGPFAALLPSTLNTEVLNGLLDEQRAADPHVAKVLDGVQWVGIEGDELVLRLDPEGVALIRDAQ
jgi:hypothetical protein